MTDEKFEWVVSRANKADVEWLEAEARRARGEEERLRDKLLSPEHPALKLALEEIAALRVQLTAERGWRTRAETQASELAERLGEVLRNRDELFELSQGHAHAQGLLQEEARRLERERNAALADLASERELSEGLTKAVAAAQGERDVLANRLREVEENDARSFKARLVAEMAAQRAEADAAAMRGVLEAVRQNAPIVLPWIQMKVHAALDGTAGSALLARLKEAEEKAEQLHRDCCAGEDHHMEHHASEAALLARVERLEAALRATLGVVEILTITAEGGDLGLAARAAYHCAKEARVEDGARTALDDKAEGET